MTLSPFVFWGVIVVLVLQIIYNLDGWRIYGHPHRALAAFSISICVGLLLGDGMLR